MRRGFFVFRLAGRMAKDRNAGLAFSSAHADGANNSLIRLPDGTARE